MRLIDADATIKEIKARNPDDVSYEDAWAITCIEHAPTIEPERTGMWIPCSERFPEEGKDVLAAVYFEGVKGFKPCHYVDIASRIDNEWSSDSDEHKIARDKHHIIAWMPLPEPYAERQGK